MLFQPYHLIDRARCAPPIRYRASAAWLQLEVHHSLEEGKAALREKALTNRGSTPVICRRDKCISRNKEKLVGLSLNKDRFPSCGQEEQRKIPSSCSACPWAQLSSSTSELRTKFSVPAKSRGSVSSKQSRTTRIQEDLKSHMSGHPFLLSMILFKAILMDGDGIAGKILAVRRRVGG
ncbi:hypothetical protein R1flu_000689 [Riccia fluitans]|uniref:Uncharacterized protein n=1 Tax=Riccia fluitans TaxID=41844 RepID=A0ABD1Y239_9MARC